MEPTTQELVRIVSANRTICCGAWMRKTSCSKWNRIGCRADKPCPMGRRRSWRILNN